VTQAHNRNIGLQCRSRFRVVGMFDLSVYLSGLVVLGAAAFLTWVVSVQRRNVAIVDGLWSLMFLMAAATYWYTAPAFDAPVAGEHLRAPGILERRELVLALVAIWAIRLAVYITARNWGHPEDRRYQAIRRRNDPGFAFKSLYLVFGLQAVLAWVISLPLLGAVLGVRPLGLLDLAGVALWLVGMIFEAGGDGQLARFRADPANAGKVMDRGLWRYTRHPNYFGDFCVWWGLYLVALSAGAWWSIVGPLLMSVLLMRVSGVTLLEKDIGGRRPGYAEYVRRTNAFFPGPPRD
jgi:steroid 5-alpha reductase family enzyme